MRERMRKILPSVFGKWYRQFKGSAYSLPFTIFIGLLVVCAVVVTILEAKVNGEEFESVLDGFWWAIITFSTTGYGDIVPITPGGRLIAVASILIGVAGMSMLSGGLASWLIDRNTRARRGLVDYSKLKDHFIICGWKQDMKEILLDIITTAKDMTPDRIVLISNTDFNHFEQLQEGEQLNGVKFVRGDYFSSSQLKRAGITHARKVIVLADTGENDTPTEIDSRTVLTVLTIKSIAREVYVVAELLDKQFESYLRYVHCDEIIFSKDVARKILASTSLVNGFSHIFYELLNQDSERGRIRTTPVPDSFVNRSFGDYRKSLQYEEDNQDVLLGLLENTGNPSRLKINSLREAQKTSDISKLVANLRQVKELSVNKPVLSPKNDYIIQSATQAIFLTTTQEEITVG